MILERLLISSVPVAAKSKQNTTFDFAHRTKTTILSGNDNQETSPYRKSVHKCCQKSCLCVGNRVIRSTGNDLNNKNKIPKEENEDDEGIPGWAIGLICITILFVLLVVAQCVLAMKNCCCDGI